MQDPAATPSDPRLGTLFEGRYRIESLIGKGGFGAVYRASQLGIERLVALKILVPALANDPREVARFQQEARIVAGLDHPHVVKVIELGQASDGSLFIAMEHLEGEPLSRFLRREGPLPLAEVRRFGRHILEGLAEAHAAGIVHRDLKPENLFVVTHPRRGSIVKLLDFGIAKVAGDRAAGVALTRTGVIVGSPRIMAPEQIVGDPVTPRTDVYAFGCVAYEMLTGRPPFVRPSAAAYARAHLNEVVPWPSRGGEPIRGPLADLVMRCLTKDPTRRPGSADEVLATWCEAQVVAAASGEAESIAERAPDALTPPSIPRSRPRDTRSLSHDAIAPSHSPVATHIANDTGPEVAHRPPTARRAPRAPALGPKQQLAWVLGGALAFTVIGATVGLVVLAPSSGAARASASPADPDRPAPAPVADASGAVLPATSPAAPTAPPSTRDDAAPEPAPCSTRERDGQCLPDGFRTPGGLQWVGIATDRWMTRTEVTAAQYAACVAAQQCDATDVDQAQATTVRAAPDAGCNYGVAGRGEHPMNCVTRAQAAAFCAWQGGTLPTVADWEAETTDGAARRVHPWGDAGPTCAVVVMGDSPTGGCGRGGTWPVCEQLGDRSASGLCDLGGNVTEWLADVPASMRDAIPAGAAALAGGAWHYDQPLAFENGVYAAEGEALRYTTVGFRCVRGSAF